MNKLFYCDALLYLMVQIRLLAAVLMIWLVVQTEETTRSS